MKTDVAPLIKAYQEAPAKALKEAPQFGKSGVHGHINWLVEAVQAENKLQLYIGGGEKLSFHGHELMAGKAQTAS